jgi:hypothetical protein
VRNPIVLSALALVACAGPLPDGSRILRDDGASARLPAALSADEARRLEQQNAQVLAEQDAARAREAHVEAMRESMYAPPYYSPWFGSPYSHWHADWVWTGSRWTRRPRWSFGLGVFGR